MKKNGEKKKLKVWHVPCRATLQSTVIVCAATSQEAMVLARTGAIDFSAAEATFVDWKVIGPAKEVEG